MGYIDIYDDKDTKKQMEVVSIFNFEGYDYHYIVYKELDGSRMYVAKYKDNQEELNTNLSKKELELCEAIMDGVFA